MKFNKLIAIGCFAGMLVWLLTFAALGLFSDSDNPETISYHSSLVPLPESAMKNSEVKLVLRSPSSLDNRESGQTWLRIELPDSYANNLLHVDAPVSGVPEILSVEHTEDGFRIRIADELGVRILLVEVQPDSI